MCLPITLHQINRNKFDRCVHAAFGGFQRAMPKKQMLQGIVRRIDDALASLMERCLASSQVSHRRSHQDVRKRCRAICWCHDLTY